MQRLHCDVCDAHPAENERRLYVSNTQIGTLGLSDAMQISGMRQVYVQAIIDGGDSGLRHLCRACWKRFLTAVAAGL